jgi:phosphate transport system substrate-binding protein
MNPWFRIFLVGVLGLGLPAFAQPMAIKSSETLVPVSQKWAEAYMAKHPDARIQAAGGGTAAAVEALVKRKTDMALVSRSMQFREVEAWQAAFGQRPLELIKVGINATAIYVHKDNPVSVLTYNELNGIFRGRYRNWNQLGGQDAAITVYGQDANTPAGELFMEEVLNRNEFTNDVRIMAEVELRKAIARDANGIGFGAFVPREGTRALSIKRVFSSTPVEPSAETISKRIYPITRFLFCYPNPAEGKAKTKDFLDWICSEEGQQIGRQAGYWPLPPKGRASQ